MHECNWCVSGMWPGSSFVKQQPSGGGWSPLPKKSLRQEESRDHVDLKVVDARGSHEEEFSSVQFSSVQSLSHVRLFVTAWTTAHKASLSITNSRSLLKLMSIELVMPSNHIIFCHPLLLPSVFLSIRVFSNESVLRIRWPKYWTPID